MYASTGFVQTAHRIASAGYGAVPASSTGRPSPTFVADLPAEDALQELERTFPERLAREVGAFLTRNPSRVRRKDGRPAAGRAARLQRLLVELSWEATEAISAGRAVTRQCACCGDALDRRSRRDAVYCSWRCRVAAHRGRMA